MHLPCASGASTEYISHRYLNTHSTRLVLEEELLEGTRVLRTPLARPEGTIESSRGTSLTCPRTHAHRGSDLYASWLRSIHIDACTATPKDWRGSRRCLCLEKPRRDGKHTMIEKQVKLVCSMLRSSARPNIQVKDERDLTFKDERDVPLQTSGDLNFQCDDRLSRLEKVYGTSNRNVL